MRTQYTAALLPSLVALVLAIIAYAAPFGNTGVNGTTGALLALIGAVAAAIGIVLAMIPSVRHGLWTGLNILLFVGIGLTTIAAYFLMQYAFAIIMGAAFLGLAFAFFYSLRRRTA